MPVMGLRMHVAVTGGRERLDAEIEIVDISAVRHVRNRLICNPVEACENRVEDHEHQRGSADEGCPGGGHAAMTDVGPGIKMLAFGHNDLATAKPDEPRLRYSLA